MYNEINAKGAGTLEVVFVSSDRSQKDMMSYMAKHAHWHAVPFDSPLRNELKRKYGCCAGSEKATIGVSKRLSGIPALVVIKSDGTLVTRSGKNDVNCFEGGRLPAAWNGKS